MDILLGLVIVVGLFAFTLIYERHLWKQWKQKNEIGYWAFIERRLDPDDKDYIGM